MVVAQMSRNRRHPSGLEWIPIVSMAFGGIFLVVVLVGVPVLAVTVLSDWFVAVGNSEDAFVVQSPAFSIYIGFVISFPTLAWSRDRVRARAT